MNNAVILASGDFPCRPALLEKIRNATHIVCCDSAAQTLQASGLREPDAIVGDLDSLDPELARRYHDRVFREAEQDTNDLSKAFRFCLSRGWTDNLVIMGATGKREDHTLGNISLLMDFAMAVPGIRMLTDYGFFEVMTRSGSRKCQPGEQLSIFSADMMMPVTARGLVYPLHKLRLERWWNATLNETTGTSFWLEFPGPSPLLLFRPWPECSGKRPAGRPSRLPWRRVHFCGCGGVGMAALANILLDDGCMVSGSDEADGAQLRQLAARGAAVHIGHAAANVPEGTQLLVYSSAVPSGNPERSLAQSRGIPQCRRGAFLARIAPFFRRVVAVAGSHGKTTVSAMIAHILRSCSADAGYAIGGNVNGWRQSGHAGDWDILVAEVDESDRTQELMLPELAVILNVDDDHSWAVGGTQMLEQSFAMLAEHAMHSIVWDTPGNRRIFAAVPSVQFLPEESAIASGVRLPIPGMHNRRNAAIAVAAAVRLGVPEMRAQAAMASYPGVQRRLALRAQNAAGTKLLYEDYAHHPTELAATLDALHEAHPGYRMAVLFQPHRPERLLRYGGQFARLLATRCDRCAIVTPFMAWEQNAPEADPHQLADAINAIAPGHAALIDNSPEIIAATIRNAFAEKNAAPMLVAVIGAGDIGRALEAIPHEITD